MKLTVLICFCFVISVQASFSQDTLPRRTYPVKIMIRDTSYPVVVPGKILDGDTVPLIDMKAFTVIPPVNFVNHNELLKYQKLVYRVRKVYPYAKLAAKKLLEFTAVLDTIQTKKERKRYIKKAEKELEDQFGDEIKNLSFSQGEILIKLIYRETGNSTFEIVKELRGGFTAFIWQTMAGVFGYNLKTAYDPENEDKMIEQIVQMIDAGLL